MNLLHLSWSNVRSKPQSTFLSIVLLAFGVGIISLLLLLEQQLTDKFDRNIRDIDLVLGAKGSPLQLILANVYHVDAPTGNIRVSDAKKIVKHPTIKEAIPLAYGDNYQKYRIVGTTVAYPNHYGYTLAEGRLFAAPFEVTIGAEVARQTGLKVGDTFVSTHGLDQEAGEGEEDHVHNTPFRVKGIFAPGDAAIDQLILTPVESVWLVHDHAHEEEVPADSTHVHAEGEEHDHDHAHDHGEEEREVTAYLLIKRTPMAQMVLPNLVKDTNMQLALPAIEVNRLSQNFGLGMDTLKAIAVLIMLLSFVSVFISLYTSLQERKYELALMRTMGGTPLTLFRLILLEGMLLVIVGYLAGVVLSRAGLFILSRMMEENFRYRLDELTVSPGEWWLLAITLAVGVVASFLPALRALRMDISKTLANG